MHDATTLCELYTRKAVGFTSSYRKSLNCLCALSNDDLQRGGRYADQGIRPTSNERSLPPTHTHTSEDPEAKSKSI